MLASSSTWLAAAQGGIERIAESFDAEVGAVVQGAAAIASVGFPADRVPVHELVEAAEGRRGTLAVPGAGVCRVVTVPVPTNPAARMVLARSGDDGFDHGEISLLRSLARIFAIALDMLTALEERRRAEQALAEARDAADAASRLKSQFLANISHEIRTPMTVVVGISEMLLDTDLDPTQRKFGEQLVRASDSLMAIINDVLDFSKIEAGRLELEPVDVDLVQVIEDVADLLGDKARAKGIELVCRTAPDVPTVVKADAARLRQVLLNLAANAVKFTDHGEVVIEACVIERGRGTARIRVDVVDTGIGIAEEDQRVLFQPFSQVDPSSTRRFGGTGLGLAICRQLVEAMHGSIGVDSAAGRGSRFWFELPFETPVTGPGERPVHDPHLKDMRVLVVDDNQATRDSLAVTIAAWGMQPDTASDGMSALASLEHAAYEGRAYDVAIVDRHMPGIGGLELSRRIRSRPSLDATQLVLLASSTPVDDEGAAAAGIRACLPKPVRRSQLHACLSAAVAAVPGPSAGSHDPRPALSRP